MLMLYKYIVCMFIFEVYVCVVYALAWVSDTVWQGSDASSFIADLVPLRQELLLNL